MAGILVSELNPVKFYQFNLSTIAKYNLRYIDHVSVEDAIMSFQDHIEWSQPWLTSDEIKIQIQSPGSGFTLNLYNCRGIIVKTVSFNEVGTNWHPDGYSVFEASLSLSDVEPDYYFATINEGGVIKIISDRIDLSEYLENSIYLQYHHRKNKGNLAFDTGIEFGLRIPAVLHDFQPGSDDTMYYDQYRNPTVLSSTPFRTYKLVIGDAFGVPDYVADKVNRILGLSNVLFDEVAFAKIEGAKMERNGDRKYPLAGWSIDVTEAINEDGVEFFKDPVIVTNYMLFESGERIFFEDGSGRLLH